MELVTLSNIFRILKPVESYESLIWSERYATTGDFEITSSDITTMVNLLPRETYVSLRESNHVMIVEDHKFVKPLRDKPMVSITGRSLESVLERRGSVNTLPATLPPDTERVPWMIEATKPSDAAFLAMRIVIGDESQVNSQGATVLPYTGPAVSSYDAISALRLILPNDYFDLISVPVYDNAALYNIGMQVRHLGFVWKALVQTQGNSPTGAAPTIWENVAPWGNVEIKPQNLYSTVLELINTNHHGIKATRPPVGTTRASIEIYNGADLSDIYVLDARFDQIDDATYLLSARGSTNVAYVYGPNGSQQVLKTQAIEPTGLDRRVLVVDSASDADANSVDVRRTRGLIELYKYNATALFDGQVAEQVAAGYNKDYFLGDIVKLMGEYGIPQKVRVAEFIRTQDSSGSKAYPTFEAIDE